MDRLLVLDLDQHSLARRDIGDRIGEDVRPLPFGQRRLLSGLPRLFVDHACLLPFLDVADNDAVADNDLERIDGAAVRQRINVSGFHPLVGRIAENLRDAGTDGRAGYRQIDVDTEPRGVGVGGVIAPEEQRAGSGIARLEESRRQGLGRPYRFKTHHQCHEGDPQHDDALQQKKQ